MGAFCHDVAERDRSGSSVSLCQVWRSLGLGEFSGSRVDAQLCGRETAESIGAADEEFEGHGDRIGTFREGARTDLTGDVDDFAGEADPRG